MPMYFQLWGQNITLCIEKHEYTCMCLDNVLDEHITLSDSISQLYMNWSKMISSLSSLSQQYRL